SINVLYSNVDNVRQMCPVQVSDATISHGFGSNGKRETLEQAITRASQIGSTEGGRVKKFPQQLPRQHKGRCGRGLAGSCGEPEPLPPASPLAAGFPEPGRHRRPDHPKVPHHEPQEALSVWLCHRKWLMFFSRSSKGITNKTPQPQISTRGKPDKKSLFSPRCGGETTTYYATASVLIRKALEYPMSSRRRSIFSQSERLVAPCA
ncbi:hypothetical protein, partial [Bilophila sp.]|uniref:hypothetical protein n=1 Tax=Bilophila sp. TaxID=1929485 RepID=UPI0030769F5B